MTHRIIALGFTLLLGGFATPAKSAEHKFCNGNFRVEEIFEPPSYSSSAPEPGEMVKISDQTRYLQHVPATFQLVKETVVVQHASTELKTVPPVWGWVEGEFPGMSQGVIVTPPEYETVTGTRLIQKKSTHYAEIPAEYKFHDGKKHLIKAPEFVEVVVPEVTEAFEHEVISKPSGYQSVKRHNVIRDGRTYMVISPARVIEKNEPALRYSTLRRVVDIPAHSIERVLDEPLYKWVPKARLPEFNSLILRDRSGKLVASFETRESFEALKSDLTCDEIREHFSG